MIVHNWPDVLRYAWSLRLIVLAGVLSGLEIVLPILIDRWPRGLAALAAIAVCAAAAVARFVAQRKVSG